jgi:hypothetical protein
MWVKVQKQICSIFTERLLIAILSHKDIKPVPYPSKKSFEVLLIRKGNKWMA